MSFANFGIGLGAFAQGLNQGIDAGTKLGTLYKQGQMRKAREEGLADAKAARSSAIDGMIQTGSAPNADNTMTVPTYNVDGQNYADQDSARKAAEGKVGSLDEFYQKVAAPKIYEQYLAVDPEKAMAWKKWNDNEQVKQGQKHWADAVMRANLGDFEGFGKSLVKAYNSRGYFEDGTQVTNWQTVKDDKGNITGAQLTFKGPDGKEYSQTVNGMEDAYRLGSYMLSPENVFNTGWQQVQAGQKARAELAKDNRKFQQNVYRDDRKAEATRQLQEQRDNASMDRTVTGKQLDAANKKAELEMRTQAELLFKKNTHPDEAVKQIVLASKKAQAANQFGPQKSDQQLVEDARKLVSDIYQNGGNSAPAQPRGNPMSGGISGQAPARGPMILDTKTGQLVPYGR